MEKNKKQKTAVICLSRVNGGMELASVKLIYKDKELREKLALTGKNKADKEYDNTTQFGKLKEILEEA